MLEGVGGFATPTYKKSIVVTLGCFDCCWGWGMVRGFWFCGFGLLVVGGVLGYMLP